jgi:imidazole glycerol-phosphate synthase subunit HisH
VTIAILDYGMGNLHSVSRAIATVGGDAVVTRDPAEVTRADALVIPGVGAFGACMKGLSDTGLDAAARNYVATGRPVIGVCIGMQVLYDTSEEDPVDGLGVLPGAVRKLPDDVKVPHMGWNTVRWIRPHPYVRGIPDGTHFYFVHSYAPDVVDDVTVGVAEHGRPFSAAVVKDNVFATQFHPEKSGEAGLAIYRNIVEAVARS